MVEAMRRGASPTDAALAACKRIAETNKDKRLRDEKGRPNFQVQFYALSKDGQFGGASLYAGSRMAVHDGERARLVDLASLYEGRIVE
jgi:N4-(beta-N-acetylglucosaminyl)-L-asparaginase